MSLELLLKNFGDKKCEAAKPVAKVAQTESIENTNTQFESLASDTECGKCGCNFFWRYNKNWFCGRCRKPPTEDFVHEVRNGVFVPWVIWKVSFKKPNKELVSRVSPLEELAAVEAYDSVIVAEGDNACPECPCRWVKETPREDGKLQRVCYSCKAVIPDGRHGTIRSQDKPFYLLPFWKWFTEIGRVS